ncbi:MAG: Gfo/Idh/MocA family oxidoreductase [Candidatus Omnitrophica bacterium]|nr:Gfo/Idh/MocA family oxidoreductase [Candidatus Omnitrophota bacterium]MCM8807577.1 Gfo/Idh/MocA family oxidoreductase [Candidatus Omnitrophota bacterium]
MIKLGVIGLGKFGTNILNSYKQLEKEGICKLVSVCDINEKVLEEQARRYNAKPYKDFKEMLEKEELDGVAIATPDPFHKEPAIYSANKKIHIFVEKPLDITIEGCIEIIEACKKNNVLLQVDFHKRFDPFHIAIKRDIEEGKIGKVEYGSCHMEDKIVVPKDWFPNWAGKSSPVWFLGVHFFDLIRWLIKSNAKSVFAKGIKNKLKSLGIDTYDSVVTIVEFENGAIISFELSWILPENFESIVNQGFRLVGEKGIIECDSQDRGTRVCYENEGVLTYNPVFINKRMDMKGNIIYTGYGIESITDFVYNIKYLKEGIKLEDLKNNSISAFGEDGLEVTKIAVYVHESIEKEKEIKL